MDVMEKAREVVKDAQLQQFILLKAQNAAEEASKVALDEQKLA